MTNIFGRRVDNVEYDPGRHDAMKDSLQPGSKNRLSCVSFPADKGGGPTVFHPVVAEATDKWVP